LWVSGTRRDRLPKWASLASKMAEVGRPEVSYGAAPGCYWTLVYIKEQQGNDGPGRPPFCSSPTMSRLHSLSGLPYNGPDVPSAACVCCAVYRPVHHEGGRSVMTVRLESVTFTSGDGVTRVPSYTPGPIRSC
jgi:hypothetical protein